MTGFLLYRFLIAESWPYLVIMSGQSNSQGFFGRILFLLRKISQRAHNLETSQLKVNDKQGNPIMIAAVVVWKVADTFRAAFDVENYEKFVEIQKESALRKMAMEYSYDNFEDEKRIWL